MIVGSPDGTRRSLLPRCTKRTKASAEGHPAFTRTSLGGASIAGMSILHPFVSRSLVGDFESEYDEFDRDADPALSSTREGRLEPSW